MLASSSAAWYQSLVPEVAIAIEPPARPAASSLPRLRVGGQTDEIDGLRGIAILLVIIDHYWPQDGALAAVRFVAERGWVGVHLFFVVSGFLITGILLDSKGSPNYYRNFFMRRFLRIFPAYYALFIGVFFVLPHLTRMPGYALFSSQLSESGSPAWYFLYVSNLRYPLVQSHPPLAMVAPLWSLAIEEQFYLTYPLFVRRITTKQVGYAAIGLIVFAFVFRLVTYLAFPDNSYIQRFSTPALMDVIAWGSLLAVALRLPETSISPRTFRRLRAAGLLALLIAAPIALLLPVESFLVRVVLFSIMAPGFASLVLWGVVQRGERSTAFMRFPPLTYLGKLCYGLYLLQFPVGSLTNTALRFWHLPKSYASPVIALLRFALLLVVAQLSWRYFESPILRLKNHFASGKE